MFTLQCAIGTCFHGLRIGTRLGVGSNARIEPIATVASTGKVWFTCGLPPPFTGNIGKAGLIKKDTCLVLLTLFIIDPDLFSIVAFNLGGHGWNFHCGKQGAKQPGGQLRVALDASSSLGIVTCVSRDEQTRLRQAYAVQPGVKRTLFGDVSDLPVYSEVKSEALQARKTGVADASAEFYTVAKKAKRKRSPAAAAADASAKHTVAKKAKAPSSDSAFESD
jgi:hypothetical protein